MRSRASKIIEVEQQLKTRRNRRNRSWRFREGQRRLGALSAKIVKLLEEDNLNGPNSPCSVMSFSLSLDNSGETHGNSEWIRTTHIKDAAVNEQDRRSPLFTGRMLRRNAFMDDIYVSRQALSHSSEDGRNHNMPRPNIHERLEPPQVSTHRRLEPSEFNMPPRFAPPDIRHHLESPSVGIHQRLEAPPEAVRSREHSEIAVPPDQSALHQNQQGNESASLLESRFSRNQYDGYNAARFSRNQFSPPRRPRNFRRSLYYPPRYTSPNQEMAWRQRQQWPWSQTSVNSSENASAYIDHDVRRGYEDYNGERFDRDAYSPPGHQHYGQSFYNRRQYSNQRRHNLRGSRSEISLPSHEINYSEYLSENYEMNFNNQRDDGCFNWPFKEVESYSSSLPPRRFYNSRPSPYSIGSSHQTQNSVMDSPYFRSLREPPSCNWEGPVAHNYQCPNQDR